MGNPRKEPVPNHSASLGLLKEITRLSVHQVAIPYKIPAPPKVTTIGLPPKPINKP